MTWKRCHLRQFHRRNHYLCHHKFLRRAHTAYSVQCLESRRLQPLPVPGTHCLPDSLHLPPPPVNSCFSDNIFRRLGSLRSDRGQDIARHRRRGRIVTLDHHLHLPDFVLARQDLFFPNPMVRRRGIHSNPQCCRLVFRHLLSY